MKTVTHIPKTFTVALCILALSPALVFAGGAAKTSAGEERGLIKAVDMNAHTLIISEHRNQVQRTFSWNDQTKFTEHNKIAGADALRAGEHVRFTYTPGGARSVLLTMRITPAKAGKPTAGKSTVRNARAKS
jgi:hypothetical protein